MNKRICKTLLLKPDDQLIDAYVNMHKPENLWPEIAAGMKSVGIIDMEIYIDQNRLFMIMEVDEEFDHESAFKELAKMPRQQEWETLMAKFQQANTLESASEKWKIVRRIYSLAEL